MTNEAKRTVGRLVLCNHCSSRSPYCAECRHGQPHAPFLECNKLGVCCASRPHVGKTMCRTQNAHALAEERSADSQQRVVGSFELKGGEA